MYQAADLVLRFTRLCCRAHVQSTTSPVQEPPSVRGSPRLTPSQTLQAHSSSLTGFEQSEILQFTEIYFWGLPTARKHEGTPHLSDLNHGCASRHGNKAAVCAAQHI